MLPQRNVRFYLFGSVLDRVDRSKEEKEIFRGYYVNFETNSFKHSLKVEKELFEEFAKYKGDCWVGGVIRANATRLSLDALEVYPISEQFPELGILEEELGLGLRWECAGTITKSAPYERNGETFYRVELATRGFNYLLPVPELNFYELQEKTVYKFNGLIEGHSEYQQAKRLWNTAYKLTLQGYEALQLNGAEQRRRSATREKAE